MLIICQAEDSHETDFFSRKVKKWPSAAVVIGAQAVKGDSFTYIIIFSSILSTYSMKYMAPSTVRACSQPGGSPGNRKIRKLMWESGLRQYSVSAFPK